MLDLLCDSCGRPLDIKYNSTIETFISKVDYLKDDLDFIKDTARNISIDYFCPFCEIKYSYFLDDVITKFVDRIVYDVKNFRKIHIYKNYINPTIVNPDNGLLFCGKCLGTDNFGNCYLDIYKQCPLKDGSYEL